MRLECVSASMEKFFQAAEVRVRADQEKQSMGYTVRDVLILVICQTLLVLGLTFGIG